MGDNSLILKTIFLVFVIIPVSFPPLIILLLWRKLIALSARIFKRGKFLKMVTGFGTVYANYTVFTRKSATIVCIMSVKRDHISLNELQSDVEVKLLNAKKTENSSELLYPEMKCNLVLWKNYYFWEICKGFDISNHVKYLNESEFPRLNLDDPRNMNTLDNYLTQDRLWKVDKPLWEFLVMENAMIDNDTRTVLIWRCHHTLCDGWSILRMAAKLFDGGTNGKVTPIVKRTGCLQNLASWLRCPYDFMNVQLNVKPFNLRIPVPAENLNTNLNPDAPKVILETRKLSQITLVKKIKDSYNTDFLSVLLAGIAAGIRNTYIRSCQTIDQNILVCFLLPMPRKGDKLRNNFTLGYILLPIGEEDSQKRLQIISDRMRQCQSSKVPTVWYSIIKCVGSLPLPLMGRVVAYVRIPVSVMLANMIGPQEECYLKQERVAIHSIGVNIAGKGTKGYAYDNRFYSYNGTGYFGVAGFDEYFPNEEEITVYLDSCILAWKKLTESIGLDETSLGMNC